MSKKLIGLRGFLDIIHEIKNRGKVGQDNSITVNYINPAGHAESKNGYIIDGNKFKIEGYVGVRLLKYPMGYDSKKKRSLVWASFNSLSDLDFRSFSKPYPFGEVTAEDIENVVSGSDLKPLLASDYSMYLVFFLAGGAFTLIGSLLIWTVSKIIIELIKVAAVMS